MKTSSNVIISAASIAAAIQAIGGIAADGGTISAVRSDAYQSQVREAMNTANTQSMVRGSLPVIANTIKIDSQLMREKYLDIAKSEPGRASTIAEYLGSSSFDVALLSSLLKNQQDSASGGASVLDNRLIQGSFCYNNCHSACHGSRGWR
jgi:hypothetical protein